MLHDVINWHREPTCKQYNFVSVLKKWIFLMFKRTNKL